MTNSPSVIIIGAGPAGLTAAYELSKSGVSSLVLEAGEQVGGLSKTLDHQGFLFDIGGHRFFTKVAAVQAMWREVLGPDLLVRPRLSRIYYGNKLFKYPLRIGNVLRGLGVLESVRCGLSYVSARVFPSASDANFAAWITNRFGARLYQIFFRTYTEKVWGMPCTEISADWAAQRIQNLSFAALLRNALPGFGRSSRSVAKTLIEEFFYPRKGPGMMWERTQQMIESRSSRVLLNSPVEQIDWEEGRVVSVASREILYCADHFVSSMPVRDLVRALRPAPPPEVLRAAEALQYRDYLAVCLICDGERLFPDNWIYIHDPSVRVGRIQNYGNWSADMVPLPGKSCLGLEYFCFEGDDLWNRSDEELIKLGTAEVAKVGLVNPHAVQTGVVLRVPKAYPVYDATYQDSLATIRRFLDRLPNLQLIGRNGMHRYNNQDHSMLTGMLAAANIMGGQHDLWSINADEEYHEAGPELTKAEVEEFESSQPRIPRPTA